MAEPFLASHLLECLSCSPAFADSSFSCVVQFPELGPPGTWERFQTSARTIGSAVRLRRLKCLATCANQQMVLALKVAPVALNLVAQVAATSRA